MVYRGIAWHVYDRLFDVSSMSETLRISPTVGKTKVRDTDSLSRHCPFLFHVLQR